MIIGREKELEVLQNIKSSDESEFVAVVGRKGIGKTYLIREAFNYDFTFEHTSVSNNTIQKKNQTKIQLEQFTKSLIKYGYDNTTPITSWFDAFDGLKTIIEKSSSEKKVIFIDELSWMDTRNSDLIPALESFWNGFVMARAKKDVILIVCASATYWMIDNIFNARGGLHNRLTKQIHLNQFTLKECEEYCLSRNIVFNKHQLIECYMIFGGVPFYWKHLERGKSLVQNINDILFSPTAPLKNEFDNLYASLFNMPLKYIKIVEELAKNGFGITRNDLLEKTGIASSGDFTQKLLELENCGFIRRYIPYGFKERNSIYQLIDNFTLFYYKIMKNNKNENYWLENYSSSKIKAWSGFAFEKVCLLHTPQIKEALGIRGISCEVNSWYCLKDVDKGINGSQIDLIIVRKDQVTNICEIKYSEFEFNVDLEFDLAMKRKVSDFTIVTKTKNTIFKTLITTYGVNNSSYAGNIDNIITGLDLFN